jgi:hypothetical protein
MCVATVSAPADKCRICHVGTPDDNRFGFTCSDACESAHADIVAGDGACPYCGHIDYPCPCVGELRDWE